MRYIGIGLVTVAVLCSTIGCSAKVDTTEDSTKVEVEGPKLDLGDQPVDADPSTDADVDVDTPAPGDK
jgi:hypothetical protein